MDLQPGMVVRFTYTRQTTSNGNREGTVSVRQGTVTDGVAYAKKGGRAFVRVDCGEVDCYGEPMPKAFRVDAMSNVQVVR